MNCTPSPSPTPTPTPASASLYVNTNDVIPGVHGYKIQSNGSLSEFPGSPFSFPNLGGGGVAFADGNLYLTTFQAGVVNPITNAIPASVDFQTGVLTPMGSGLASTGNGEAGKLTQCQSHFLFSGFFDPPFLLASPIQISGFSIESSGTLHAAPGSPFTLDTTAISTAVDPMCRFLFVFSQNGIFSYAIDASTGALTLTPGSPFVFSNNPDVGAVDPTGSFLYGVGPVGVSIYSIGAGGAIAAASGPVSLPATGGGIVALTVSQPSANFLYVSAFQVSGGLSSVLAGYKINGGTLTPVPGSAPISGNNTKSLASFGSFLYCVNFLDDTVSAYNINSDGTLSSVPGSPFGMQNRTTSAIHPTTAAVATKP